MLARHESVNDSLPTVRQFCVADFCQAYESAWNAGTRPRIESLVVGTDPQELEALLARLIRLEVQLRTRVGEVPSLGEYQSRFPGHTGLVEQAFKGGRQEARPTPSPDATPAIVGDYELLCRVGQGGMGVVYKSLQRGTGRTVAVKLLRPDLIEALPDCMRREAVQRFLSEARLAASLTHDHIVTVYGAGEHDGCPYYAMQFIEGEPLSSVIRRGPVEARTAAAWVLAVAGAVDFAHNRGILHRDLKPSNILIGAGRRPYVADFGLAKQLQSEVDRQTPSYALLGTPAYMAPEILEGVGASRFSASADVYSLGVTLYELITGKLPFVAPEPVKLFRLIAEEEPVAPSRLVPTIPRDLETICLKCMAKSPALRYPSAAALGEDLALFLSDLPIRGRRASMAVRASRLLRRRWGYLAGGVLLVAALLGLFSSLVPSPPRDVESLVQAVKTAHLDEIPGIVDGMPAERPKVAETLGSWVRDAPDDRDRKMRAALVCLEDDPTRADFLCEELLACRPREISVISELIRRTQPEAWSAWESRYWGVLSNGSEPSGRRLRAASALARACPTDPRWEGLGESLADLLVSEVGQDSSAAADWCLALGPVGTRLKDRLMRYFQDRSAPERGVVAAWALAELASDSPESLAQWIADAAPEQLGPLVSKWLASPKPPADLLLKLLAEPASSQALSALDARAKRRANAAAVLLCMGKGDDVVRLLESEADPSARSYLAARIGRVRVPPGILLDLLPDAPKSCLQVLLLALGEYDPRRFEPAERGRATASLLTLYREHPDSGVHSAAGWALRRWGHEQVLQDADRALVTASAVSGRNWYRDFEGHTLTVIRGPVQFDMIVRPNAAAGEVEEKSTRCELAYDFAVAVTKVTVDQYLRFLQDEGVRPGGHTSFFHGKLYDEVVSPTGICPINSVNYHAAACYCNWLSRRAGLPSSEWCYERVDDGPLGPVRLHPDYRRRIGYRLLDEEEWICTYRAGTPTRYFFGRTLELLDRFEWFSANSAGRTHPVGTKWPNQLGMHDMLGSLYEWCSPAPWESPQRQQLLKSRPFINEGWMLDSARVTRADPIFVDTRVGFRVARTIRPEGSTQP